MSAKKVQSQVELAINNVTATLGITKGASVDEPIEEDAKKPAAGAETARGDGKDVRNSDDQFYTYLAYKGLKSVKALELNRKKQAQDLVGCTFVPKIKDLPGGKTPRAAPQVFNFDPNAVSGNPSTQPALMRQRARTARGRRDEDDSNEAQGAKPVHLRLASQKRDITKIKKE